MIFPVTDKSYYYELRWFVAPSVVLLACGCGLVCSRLGVGWGSGAQRIPQHRTWVWDYLLLVERERDLGCENEETLKLLLLSILHMDFMLSLLLLVIVP